MAKYLVRYYMDGKGEVKIEANSKEDAKEKFFDGDYNEKDDKEWGENYAINTVEAL